MKEADNALTCDQMIGGLTVRPKPTLDLKARALSRKFPPPTWVMVLGVELMTFIP